MMTSRYESPIGTWILRAENGAITALSFGAEPLTDGQATPEDRRALDAARRWLDAFFAGRAGAPLPPLAPAGTVFQQTVWAETMRVPFGAAVTYGELAARVARRMGKERMSARAVGQALGSNPVMLMIPCHRVLAKGGLGGFSSGLPLKKILLSHEKQEVR